MRNPFFPIQGVRATSVGSSAFPLLAPNGTAAAPSYSFSASPTYGIYSNAGTTIDFSLAGNRTHIFSTEYYQLISDTAVFYMGLGADIAIARDDAAVLALKNGTTAQTFRVYGTTTGTKYGAFAHNATDTVISGTFGHISLRTVDLNTAANTVDHTATATITGAVTDGYTAGLRLTPTYSAATALTVTRHNYIDLNGPTLSGAGPAALTDAAVFRFDAAAGTHKATVGATTKTTPGAVDAWVKINMNGTLLYIPAYTSTTA